MKNKLNTWATLLLTAGKYAALLTDLKKSAAAKTLTERAEQIREPNAANPDRARAGKASLAH